MPLPESQDHLFEHKVGGGLLALFGLPFAIAGIGIMIGPLFSANETAPLYFHLPFGTVFFLLGSGLVFGRYRIQVDARSNEIQRQWRLFVPLRTVTRSLAGASEVRISHEIRKSKNSSYSVYPVKLRFEAGDSVNLESPRSLQRARKLGEDLAKFLALALTDASQGSVSTRQADELDLNLKQRMKAGRLETDIPEPPHRLLSKIDFDGGRLRVEIPPPGPQLQLMIAIIPVLGFIGFAAFVVLRPMLQSDEGLPFPLALFMIAFFALPSGIVLSLLAKMFLFRQTLLADSAIVSHSRGSLFRKTTTLPSDQVEEILLGRANSARSKSTVAKGKPILIQSDAKSIRVTNHLPAQETAYILSLLRAVIAS